MVAARGLGEPEFDLTVVSSRPAPNCSVPATIEVLDTRQPARMRFVARCPDGSGWRHEFIVRARMSALVAVTSAPVTANVALGEADVTLERRDITTIADPLGAIDDVDRKSVV